MEAYQQVWAQVKGIYRDTLQEVFGEIFAGDLVVRKGTKELAENTVVQVIDCDKTCRKSV